MFYMKYLDENSEESLPDTGKDIEKSKNGI